MNAILRAPNACDSVLEEHAWITSLMRPWTLGPCRFRHGSHTLRKLNLAGAKMKWLSGIFLCVLWNPQLMADELLVIQPAPNEGITSEVDTSWRLITDGVMGGLSSGTLSKNSVEGRPCMRLRGDVSLKNNGGFIQAAVDIGSTPAANASAYQGIMLEVYGNNQEYNLHLRSNDVWLPWQSYRASFVAPAKWQTIKLPFSSFSGYRIRKPLDLAQLKRIGVVAIGREFAADLCIGQLALYRDNL